MKKIKNELLVALSEVEKSKETINMLTTEMTMNEQETKDTNNQLELLQEKYQSEQDNVMKLCLLH